MGKYVGSIEGRAWLSAQVRLSEGHEEEIRLLNQPVPDPVSVRLIIDSGSKRSSLLPWIIARLQPASLGLSRVETSTGSVEAPLFWIGFDFPETSLESVQEIAVARLPLPPSLGAFHGLIGRDLLDRWDSFCYHGRRGRFTIRDKTPWWSRWLPL